MALHVLGRRADGYHELDSIVAFCGIADTLSFAPAADFSLSLAGPFAPFVPAGEENLVMKAARRFVRRNPQSPRYRIALEKNLPVAAGIGGGSADAAATLRGLAALSGCDGDLSEIAAELGSDVPVCLADRACRVRGRGERLEPAGDFPETPAVLVNPKVPLATADVFRELGLAPGQSGFSPLATPPGLAVSRNDLTAPAMRLAPVIAEMLETLAAKGASLARMSGSGPTCFGLFASPDAARAAAQAILAARPHWWVKATVIG